MNPRPETWRYPGERPMFVGTLLVIAAVFAVLVPVTFGGALVVAALGGLAAVARVTAIRRRVRKVGVPAAQHPRLAPIVDTCRARLGMGDEVEVYLVGGEQRNAFAIGLARPYVVAVHAGLFAALDDEELAFVVGHELGHVHLRHTRALALTGHLGQAGGGLVSVLLRRVVFLGWSRAAEFSADRAGLLACGQLHAALSALFKVGLPPAQLRGAHLPTLVGGAVERYQREDVSLLADLRSLARTHPGLEQRLDNLVDFAGSAVGRRALEGAP